MTSLVVVVFVLTYIGMALGRFPGLRVHRNRDRHDRGRRAGGGRRGGDKRPRQRHPFSDAAADGRSHGPLRPRRRCRLLRCVCDVDRAPGRPTPSAACSYRRRRRYPLCSSHQRHRGLCNDTVAVCRPCHQRAGGAGLAAASNAGSAATFIGHPQNIPIGQAGRLGFWSFLAVAVLPAIVALAITFGCIALTCRSELRAEPKPGSTVAPHFDHRQTAFCAAALLALLTLFTTPLPRETSALLVPPA
jgi:hypothetical protein